MTMGLEQSPSPADPLADAGAAVNTDAIGIDGLGCHSGRDAMQAAAAAAGKSEILEQYKRDYPVAGPEDGAGPHDQPQSMCPAFGSLRVGLRMRRTMSILSGSACCVYGLTFTSHFYGARRSVGYVPFNSETLVTDKLFEDIRDAVHANADPDQPSALRPPAGSARRGRRVRGASTRCWWSQWSAALRRKTRPATARRPW